MKRRVIAIVVVLASVTVACWANWEPLWRAVMTKKMRLSTAGAECVIWASRWGNSDSSRRTGQAFFRYKSTGGFLYIELKNGHPIPDGVATEWDESRRVVGQRRLEGNGPNVIETRTSPPWWPHPPLIDLREFEE